MIGDWQNSGLCLEDGIKPATDNLITLQSIYSNCLEGVNIIDEDATFEQFGYRSNELSCGSCKNVVAVCNSCKNERIIPFYSYVITTGRCKSCANKGKNNPMYGSHRSGRDNPFYGKHHSDKTKDELSEAHQGRWGGKNNPMYGIHICGEDHHMFGKHRSEKTKRKISATQQCCTYNEWASFAKDQKYCPEFNELCKESNRNKYNRECFICGLPETENKYKNSDDYRKLSVHHVDMNKNQGCDGHNWKLIPVCVHCHRKLHNQVIGSYITYILENEVS